MPNTVNDLTGAAQDQVLATIKSGQSIVLDGVRAWAEAVQSITPASLTPSSIPGLDALPNPAEAVDASFDFAAKLLAAQREFATALVASVAPATKPAGPAKK